MPKHEYYGNDEPGRDYRQDVDDLIRRFDGAEYESKNSKWYTAEEIRQEVMTEIRHILVADGIGADYLLNEFMHDEDNQENCTPFFAEMKTLLAKEERSKILRRLKGKNYAPPKKRSSPM